jgi:hypothetical protein
MRHGLREMRLSETDGRMDIERVVDGLAADCFTDFAGSGASELI